ncbi:hypothetical protein ANTPLA_LOCUS707 [Anthophora plagiata]
MKTSNAKLLLVSVLCIISCSFVQSDNEVTINSFDVDIPDNDVMDSWTYDLANNLIGSTINVKKNCPDSIEMETRIYQENEIVNQIVKQLEKPIKDFESYGICATIDYPEPDDDTCSIAEGEQSAKDCDVSEWFRDMSPGKYTIQTDFKQNDNMIACVKIDVTVESA